MRGGRFIQSTRSVKTFLKLYASKYQVQVLLQFTNLLVKLARRRSVTPMNKPVKQGYVFNGK